MGLNENGKVLLEKIESLKLNPFTIDQIKGFIVAKSNCCSRDLELKQVLLKFEGHESYKRSVYGAIVKHIDAGTLHDLNSVDDWDAPDEPAPKAKQKAKPKAKPDPDLRAAFSPIQAQYLESMAVGKGLEERVDERLDKERETRRNEIDTVERLVSGTNNHMLKRTDNIRERLKTLETQPPKRIEFNYNNKIREVKGYRHKDFEPMVKTVTSRDTNGLTCPLWLYGPPGGGKTTIAHQIGEALGLKVYEKSISPTDTSSVIVGYRNIANGGFVEGLVYQPFKHGGVVVIDEFCNGDPGVAISMNGITANDRVMFPNGEMVHKHKDFFIVVADNTKGEGSTGGYRRNKVDAATKSRFSFFEVEYDEKLEKDLAQHDEWVGYVQKVRAYVKVNSPANVYISPRISYTGAAQLRSGMEWDRVAKSTLFGTLSNELIETIKQNVKR
jgi:hypothetical protein